MLRLFLAAMIFLHGCIHLMGVAKAYRLGTVAGITKHISKPAGLLWLAAALLLVVTAAAFLLQKESWWKIGLAAAILSQALIFTVWRDAKYGTVANAIILLACILAMGNWPFAQGFRKDVAAALKKQPATTAALTEKQG